jgi:cell division protease FtsH
LSKEYIEINLCHLLAGRAAEMLVLDHLSTGAADDIERATDLARKMVCEWGMSEKLGPITFGKKEEEIFLGREIAQHRDFSENTAQEIDREVRNIISNAEKTVKDLLSKNIDKLHQLAEALLEREILDGEEIDIILAGKKLPKKVTEAKSKKQSKTRKKSTTKTKDEQNGEVIEPDKSDGKKPKSKDKKTAAKEPEKEENVISSDYKKETND